MEVHLMNFDGLNYLDSQIGCQLADGTFVVAPECAEALDELIGILECEDMLTRPVRCRLAFMDIVKQTLVPLLLNLDEVVDTDRTSVFVRTMKMLAHLTQPMDCLLPEGHCSASSRVLAKEIDNYVMRTQILFTQPEVNKAILQEVTNIMEKRGLDKPVQDIECEAVNYTVYFYRNLLFSVDKEYANDSLPLHAEILRWMLKFGIKDLLMKVIVSPQREYWCVAVVQLLSLMFKDERCMEGLQNGSDAATSASQNRTQGLLSSSSDSHVTGSNRAKGSEDSSLDDFFVPGQNEGNTPNDKTSVNQAPTPTTDKQAAKEAEPNFKPANKKQCDTCGHKVEGSWANGNTVECEQTAAAGAAVGVSGTGAGDTEGNTDGSKCREEQQISEEAKLHEKVKEADTWQQIREGMGELCVEFLQKGWVPLLKCVKTVLLCQNRNKYQLQSHYFMWLVQHFTQLLRVFDTPFSCVRDCFSLDTVGFLVYRTVSAFQQLSIAKHADQDLASFIRQSYLPLVALHELFNAISHYWETCQNQDDKVYLLTLMGYLTGLEELGMLFVLLIRHCDLDLLGKNFLQEAVLAVHKFLLMADLVFTNGGSSHRPLNMLTYVHHFATSHMMLQYGRILEDFQKNSGLLNQCVFTMMHHVAGDCGQPTTLLQAPIIQTFIKILDMTGSKNIVPQECHDLMEYILQTCLRCLDSDPLSCVCLLCGVDMEEETQFEEEQEEGKAEVEEGGSHGNRPPSTLPKEHTLPALMPGDVPPWSPAEEDELFALFSEHAGDNSVDIDDIVSGLRNVAIDKSPKDVLVELHRQGLLSAEKMMEQLSIDPQQNTPTVSSPSLELPELDAMPVEKRTEHCVHHLVTKSNTNWLQWLQGALLEACYVKVIPDMCQVRPKEPIFWHCTMLEQPMPLVAYTVEQEAALQDPYFRTLLEALGLEQPEPTRVAYPNIPTSMTPKQLWESALLLGPVMEDKLCFTPEDMEVGEPKMEMHTTSTFNDMRREPDINSSSPSVQMWPFFVQKLNKANRKDNFGVSQESAMQ